MKDSVLWFCQSRALSEAGINLLKIEPEYSKMPDVMLPVLYRQHFSSALMLIGYSFEVVFKATYLRRVGLEEYKANERKIKHHNLVKLSKLTTEFSDLDLAVMKCLTEMVYWGGRYSDHGDLKSNKLEETFQVCKLNKISIKTFLDIAQNVFGYCADEIIK